MYRFQTFGAEDLGKAIRSLRKQRGWTQLELAEWLGINPVTVMRMERGRPVALTYAMRAISLLGAKAVIVPKWASIEATGEEPAHG